MMGTTDLSGLPVLIALGLLIEVAVWWLWVRRAEGSTFAKTAAILLVSFVVLGAVLSVLPQHPTKLPAPPTTVVPSDQRYMRWVPGPNEKVQVFTPQPGSQAEHDLKTTGTLNPRYTPWRTLPPPP